MKCLRTEGLIPRRLIFLLGTILLSVDAQFVDAQTAREPLVLAHYMPWYTAKPFSDRWGWHWTMNHFDCEKQQDGRREIASKFYPMIGPYDSGDPNVLECHLLLMSMAGIDGVIVDWYGRSNVRDYSVLHRNTTRILQQCERLRMKLVICYEDQTIPVLVNAKKISEAQRVAHAVEEIDWLGKYWFQSPSYVKLADRPVLLSFGHAGLKASEWEECLKQLQSPVAYFSQDIRRKGAVGGFGWPAPKVGLAQVDRFLSLSAEWPERIPAAFPRFDDIYKQAGVSDGYPELPDNGGQTLQNTLKMALDTKASLIQIATWNDWGEGTQIEPSLEHGFRDLAIVQKTLAAKNKHEHTGRINDFDLPVQLLTARRNGLPEAQADAIAQKIREGKLVEASQLLGKHQP